MSVLVNNAANDDRHKFEEVTPAYWEQPHRGEPAPHLLRRPVRHRRHEEGRRRLDHQPGLGLLASRPSPDLSIYETAKAGIEGLTRALARDLGESNIRVNCVVPGAVRTPRQMKLWHTPEEEAKILAQQCLKARVDPVRRHRDGVVSGLRRRAHVYCAQLLGGCGLSLNHDRRRVCLAGRVQYSVKDLSGPRRAGVMVRRYQGPPFIAIDPASGAEAVVAGAGAGRLRDCPAAGGTLIAGLKTGLHRFDPGKPATSTLTAASVEPSRGLNNRLNDGSSTRRASCGSAPWTTTKNDPSGVAVPLD